MTQQRCAPFVSMCFTTILMLKLSEGSPTSSYEAAGRAHCFAIVQGTAKGVKDMGCIISWLVPQLQLVPSQPAALAAAAQALDLALPLLWWEPPPCAAGQQGAAVRSWLMTESRDACNRFRQELQILNTLPQANMLHVQQPPRRSCTAVAGVLSISAGQ